MARPKNDEMVFLVEKVYYPATETDPEEIQLVTEEMPFGEALEILKVEAERPSTPPRNFKVARGFDIEFERKLKIVAKY